MKKVVVAAAALGATAVVCAGGVFLSRSLAASRAAASLSPEHLSALNGNEGLLSQEELELVAVLLDAGQHHLFEAWPGPWTQDHKKRTLLRQLVALDKSYAGGLKKYISNAKDLLTASARGDNPFDGYTPSVPQGVTLEYGKEKFQAMEADGVAEASSAAFVLVAGGIGERLGYTGIKVGIPTEVATESVFLKVYIEYIKAIQLIANKGKDTSQKLQIPLAIMTSDDTHTPTLKLLRDNSYFGLNSSQVHLMKQEKVACFSDNEASLALDKDDPFMVQTKPHGHGDVHALLASTGLALKWHSEGKKWVCFFQDTNALVFRGLLAALGVSKAEKYDFNALAVPRKAKEAIGAITKLKHKNGSQMTINVEYNQLEPLLKATINPEGDVNDNSTGYSPYPGNINQLVLSLSSYVEMLERTGGVIGEFVNPKYTDASRTVFKKSTRLECMMQDYPKGLSPTAKVGFTTLEVWAAYSPVKNHPDEAMQKHKNGDPSHSGTSGELDIYSSNCRALEMLGAKISVPEMRKFNGMEVALYPRVVLSPAFAPSFGELTRKVDGAKLKISQTSVLVLDGPDISIKSLSVNGTLTIKAVSGAEVVIDGLTVNNKGWEWQALEDTESAPQYLRIRGFKLVKHAGMQLSFKSPGKYVLSDRDTSLVAKYRV